jgi:hypothetical protein
MGRETGRIVGNTMTTHVDSISQCHDQAAKFRSLAKLKDVLPEAADAFNGMAKKLTLKGKIAEVCVCLSCDRTNSIV